MMEHNFNVSIYVRVTHTKKKDLCALEKLFISDYYFLLIKHISMVRFCCSVCSHKIERERGAYFSFFKRMCFASYTEPMYRWMFRITSEPFSRWNKRKNGLYIKIVLLVCIWCVSGGYLIYYTWFFITSNVVICVCVAMCTYHIFI